MRKESYTKLRKFSIQGVMFCRSCNKELPDNSQACFACGRDPLTGWQYCHQCGSKTHQQQDICLDCGCKVTYQAKNPFDLEDKYCKNCSQKIDKGVVLCLFCNKEFGQGDKFCGGCGRQVKEDQVLCIHCGVAVTDLKDQVFEEKNAEKETEKINAFIMVHRSKLNMAFYLFLGVFAYSIFSNWDSSIFSFFKRYDLTAENFFIYWDGFIEYNGDLFRGQVITLSLALVCKLLYKKYQGVVLSTKHGKNSLVTILANSRSS